MALDVGLVDLLDAVARVRQAVCERAVVREQECAGRVGVEAADGNDARRVADEVDDGSARMGVARGGDRAGGLVEQHVGELLRRDRLAVDLDAVA